MALTVEQKPLYTLTPVGQEVIFTVIDADTVANYFNVKYIAEVHISTNTINLATNTALVGTFKTTPNNTGTGIFDFSKIVESFVSPDNLAAIGSSYKNTATSAILPNPLHLIDKYSLNDNIVRYLKIKFYVEGSTTATDITQIIGDAADSTQFTLFNGYLKYTDLLIRDVDGNFGFDTSIFNLNESVLPPFPPQGKYLTNAPLSQYANDKDYGTISFISTETGSDGVLNRMKVKYYNSAGIVIGIEDDIPNNIVNGGYTTFTNATKNQLIHFGCFPANLRNWGSNFESNLALGTLAYYEVYAENTANRITDKLRIYLLCPTLKGYEPIRLTWLNQWGVWDYYTFTMKSAKTISTKGSTYQQLEGTWNESIYIPSGYKGGKKAFRVNATEKISMNTDFINEAEAEWFEELINSPEVYILEGYQTDPTFSSLNTYVTPARLTTSNYTRKTVANDKLIQYTFEVEKSKTLRTQAV